MLQEKIGIETLCSLSDFRLCPQAGCQFGGESLHRLAGCVFERHDEVGGGAKGLKEPIQSGGHLGILGQKGLPGGIDREFYSRLNRQQREQ